MNIISHRGFWWPNNSLQNTENSFEKAISHNYGIETDFRNNGEDIIISHDISTTYFSVEDFFGLIKKDVTIAMNIKTDGMLDKIKTLITKHKISNYFFFDMSVAEMFQYINAGLPVYTRQSDIEKYPVFYDESKGIWIDTFNDLLWMQPDIIYKHIENKKEVCIVSPELHGYPYKELWEMIKRENIICDNISICTDYPIQADDFFNGGGSYDISNNI